MRLALWIGVVVMVWGTLVFFLQILKASKINFPLVAFSLMADLYLIGVLALAATKGTFA